MDNVVIPYTDDGDSSDNEPSDSSSDEEHSQLLSNNVGVLYNQFNVKDTKFMNMERAEEYQIKRNELFTPELRKLRILVDSKNVDHSSDHSTSNYTVLLDSDTSNTAGFQNYTNVIGFRLIKAIVPNTVYQVTTNNSTINFNYDGSPASCALTSGAYIVDDLADEIETKMNAAVSGTPFTVTPNDVTYKYRIQSSVSSFYFLKSSAWRLLGLLNMDEEASAASTDKTLPNVFDHSIHFVNLVIPEIPYIACKHNMSSKNIIDRIPLNVEPGGISYYTVAHDRFDNYFYPINLAKLTIQLYEDTNDALYDCQNGDNSFEFELTILNQSQE